MASYIPGGGGGDRPEEAVGRSGHPPAGRWGSYCGPDAGARARRKEGRG